MTLDTLFPHFHDLIRTPADVQRLNEAILQLAVQGKLVPQDPDDEPASELLERIEAEKKRLVKEGKIGKAKPLPPIKAGEMPYPLPVGWEWARFGTITDHRLGKMLDKQKNRGEYKRYVRNLNVQWDHIDLNDIQVMRFEPREFDEYRLIEGDLLVCEGGEPGRCAIWQNNQDEMMFQKAIHRARPLSNIVSRYLLFHMWADASSGRLVEQFTGATIKHFTGQALTNYLLSLPPLAEQKRIVARVDALFAQTRALEAKLRQAQADIVVVNKAALHRLQSAGDNGQRGAAWATVAEHFDLLYSDARNVAELRQAILQLAVQGKLVPQDPDDEPASELLKRIAAEKRRLEKEGKIGKAKPLPPIKPGEAPYSLPEGWVWSRLPDVGELARGKSKHRPRNDPALYENGNYPFVQTGDIARSNRSITTYSSTYNDFGLAQSRMWPEGTLCITIAANIGETGILGFDACFPDSVVGFLPMSPIDSVMYFFYFLNVAQSQLEEFAPATAQKNINLGILQSLLVPLPPLAEQKRIVAKADQLMALCDALEAKLGRAEAEGRVLAQAVLAGVRM